MKHLSIIAFTVLFGMTLIACNTTTTTTQNPYLISGMYPNDLVFEMVEPMDPYFHSELTDIAFDTVLGEVCFDYRIIESLYAIGGYSFFFAIKEVSVGHYTNSNYFSNKLTDRVCIDLGSSAGEYEVGFFGNPSTASVSSTEIQYQSSGFRFTIPSLPNRLEPIVPNASCVTVASETNCYFLIRDVDRMVNSITFVVVRVADDTSVFSQTYVAETYYEDFEIYVHGIDVGSLVLNTEYKLLLLADGTDGIETFSTRLILEKSYVPD